MLAAASVNVFCYHGLYEKFIATILTLMFLLSKASCRVNAVDAVFTQTNTPILANTPHHYWHVLHTQNDMGWPQFLSGYISGAMI